MKKPSKKTKNTHSKIVKQFQEIPPTFKGHTNTMPSMTVPDMTLTVKQLLHNHTRGIHSDVSHNEPMYFDSEIPIIDDITDLIAYREDLKAREIALKAKIKQEHDNKILEHQKLIIAQQEALNKETEQLEVKPKGENL